MRRLLLALVLALCAAPALAQTSAQTLRDLARAGDFAGLQHQFDAAQAAVIAGRANPDDLRDMVSALIVTDPRIRAAMANWVETDPNSAPAAAINAFIRYNDSFTLRGEKSRAETYPPALDAFSRLQAEGLELALTAYAAAPDFIPATDAMIFYQTTMRPLTPRAFDAMLADVMALTPNPGTLERAGYQAQPQWGGEGPMAVAQMCATHAPLITDIPGYDAEVCFIRTVLDKGYGPDVQRLVVNLLRMNSNPLLADEQVLTDAIMDPVQRQAATLAYLQRETTIDADLAWRYDDGYVNQPGFVPMLDIVAARSVADARALLVDDPYNPTLLLRVLSSGYSDAVAEGLSRSEQLALARDLVIAAPTSPQAWTHLAYALRHNGDDDTPAARVARINAVVYSNHDANVLSSLRWAIAQQASALAEDDFAGIGTDPAPEGVDQLPCTLIRATRLLAEACVNPDPGDSDCSSSGDQSPRFVATMAAIASHGLCQAAREDPLEAIRFQPIAMDLAVLTP